jgi:hypothetical protein
MTFEDDPPSFAAAAEMLRVGHKYQVYSLRDEAAARFRCEFPSKLEDWDEIITNPCKEIRLAEQRGETKEYSFMECVNLAAECNLPELLPSALLWLCGLDIKNIFSGCIGPSADLMFLECANIARESSLLDPLPSLFVYLLEVDVEDIIKGHPRADGCCALLSLPNQHSWILGFEALQKAQYEETFRYVHMLPYPGCLAPGACTTFKAKQIQEYVAPPTTLAPVERWHESWHVQLYTTCRKFTKKSHSNGRRRVWASLPTLFDFPPSL